MKTTRSKNLFWFAAAILLLSAWMAIAQTTSSFKETNDIAVVVNARNETSELSMSDLRKILLGEHKFWRNKTPVVVVLRQPGTRERDEIVTIAAKMADQDFRRHWQAMIFRGEASVEPLTVPSNGMATEYVSSSLEGAEDRPQSAWRTWLSIQVSKSCAFGGRGMWMKCLP